MGRKKKQESNVKPPKPSKILTSRLVMLNFKVEDYVYHHKPLPIHEVKSYLQELECYKETCHLDARTEQVISKLIHSMKNIIFEANEKEKNQANFGTNIDTNLHELKSVIPPKSNTDLDDTISIADSSVTNCESPEINSPKSELAPAVARINIEIGSPSILTQKHSYTNPNVLTEENQIEYSIQIIPNPDPIITTPPKNKITAPKRKTKTEEKGIKKPKRERKKTNAPKERKAPAKRSYTRKKNNKGKDTAKVDNSKYWLEGLQYIRQVDAAEESKPVWLTPAFWNDVSFPPDWDSNDFIY